MGLIRRVRFGRRPTDEERILVIETEQFLSGGLAADLLARGAPVPAWAWLGFLAHTPEDELEFRADELLGAGPPLAISFAWQGAVSLLVQEIVATAEPSGRTVGDLQEALVVELEARSHPAGGAVDRGPEGLIQDVCSVLVRCRDGRER